MATTLTVNSIKASLNWNFTNALDYANTVNQGSFAYSDSLADGTAADQANRIYLYESTLAATTALNLDLAGTLTDVFGSVITMARIKVIYVELTGDTAGGPILVGGHATLGVDNWLESATDHDTDQPSVRVRRPGVFLLSTTDATGYAVTATTEDMLRIYNEHATIAATIRVGIVGVSV